jgi:hypothetical protein
MSFVFDRRRFHELSAAAVSGLYAGGMLGCNSDTPTASTQPTNSANAAAEKHLCRGLNDCKAQGKSGKNDCRGLGDCATFAAHECGGHNACKGQGGCGEKPGLNECRGQGACAVPLMNSAWSKVRERMEEKWKKANATFGSPEKQA